MQLPELCTRIAPIFELTPAALRVRQQELYKVPEFRAVGMTGKRGFTNEALLATASASALLVLTAMLGYSKDRIAPEVLRLWKAGSVTPTGNPIEQCRTAGAVLTVLLERADVRGRLAFFELDRDIPHLAFVFGRTVLLKSDLPRSPIEWQRYVDGAVAIGTMARTFYAPYSPKEWQSRIDRAFRTGKPARLTRLPASTLDKVAALIEQDRTAA